MKKINLKFGFRFLAWFIAFISMIDSIKFVDYIIYINQLHEFTAFLTQDMSKSILMKNDHLVRN